MVELCWLMTLTLRKESAKCFPLLQIVLLGTSEMLSFLSG